MVSQVRPEGSAEADESPAIAVQHAGELSEVLEKGLNAIVAIIDKYASAALSKADALSSLPSAIALLATVKRHHVSLQRATRRARDAVVPAARDAVEATLALESARYEASALERELEMCESMHTPHLDALQLPIEKLNEEMEARRKLSERVAELRRTRDERARRVRVMEDAVAALPDQVFSAMKNIPVLQKHIDKVCVPGGPCVANVTPLPSELGLDDWSQLPAPLYTLVYQTLGCASARVVNGISISVMAVKIEGGNLPSSAEDELHRVEEWGADLKIHLVCDTKEQEDVPFGATLRFAFHEALGIVSVSVVDGDINVDELTELFEKDKGIESPNPSSSFLQDGNFRFDTGGEGKSARRAYRWVNSLCGLQFLPSGDERGAIPAHLRFETVVERIKARMQVLDALKRDVVALENESRKRKRDETVASIQIEKVNAAARRELKNFAHVKSVVYKVMVKGRTGVLIVNGIFVVSLDSAAMAPVVHLLNTSSIATDKVKGLVSIINEGSGQDVTLKDMVEKLIAGIESIADAASPRVRDTRRKLSDREHMTDYSDV